MRDRPDRYMIRAKGFEYLGETDFFMGFGYSRSVAMFLQAILLWLLASLAKRHPADVRPFTAALFLASLVNVGISWKFIFPVPVIFGLVLTACIGVSYLLLAKQPKDGHM